MKMIVILQWNITIVRLIFILFHDKTFSLPTLFYKIYINALFFFTGRKNQFVKQKRKKVKRKYTNNGKYLGFCLKYR